VKDSSSEFLQYLDKYNIALGTNIGVLSKESYDESMTVKINNIKRLISKEVAQNLFVKTI
jgi:DtxR family Mn-dependent transcriptional regulator